MRKLVLAFFNTIIMKRIIDLDYYYNNYKEVYHLQKAAKDLYRVLNRDNKNYAYNDFILDVIFSSIKDEVKNIKCLEDSEGNEYDWWIEK
jgi:hypothetical protein